MYNSVLDNVIDDFELPIKTCPRCGGYGNITCFCGHDVEEVCPKCEGKGYVRKKVKKYSKLKKYEK